MDRFISEKNIARYREKLKENPDAATRAQLTKLLAEEEKRFGHLPKRPRNMHVPSSKAVWFGAISPVTRIKSFW